MTPASTLLELAKRCEKASGPDRELDEAIQAALAGATIEWQETRQANAYHRDGRWVSIGAIQPYTSSLDAAMSLVPKSHDFVLGTGHGCAGTSVFPIGADRHDPNNAASPALALTAASLRALAAQP